MVNRHTIIDDTDDQLGRSTWNVVPSFRQIGVRIDEATTLPHVVEVPLIGKSRIVRNGKLLPVLIEVRRHPIQLIITAQLIDDSQGFHTGARSHFTYELIWCSEQAFIATENQVVVEKVRCGNTGFRLTMTSSSSTASDFDSCTKNAGHNIAHEPRS